MKSNSKQTLKILFASLISNEAAINGAKLAPWWIGVILFILGSFLPIIPIMTSTSKTYGASFMNINKTYGFEQHLTSCGVELQAEKYQFTINDKHELIETIDGVAQERTWGENEDGVVIDTIPVAYYNTVVSGVTQRALNVFYYDRPWSGSGNNNIKYLRDKIIEKTLYDVGTDVVHSSESEKATFIPSYVILYKGGIFAKIYQKDSTKYASVSYSGADWKKFEAGTELLKLTLGGDNISPELVRDMDYINSVKENWKTVFNKTYENQKIKTFWLTSGMYYGIYIVLGFFMGFMMWLLTRGKNNPNRNLSIFIGFKISWWIDFTPGLLGMIAGFIYSPIAGIAYIVLMGIRAMWLSMRQLNPAAQQ